jgi:acyl carrier protein
MSKALDQQLAEDENFFDAGGDSLATEEVLSELSDKLRFDVPGWLLLDNPSPADLAAALIREHGQAKLT